MALPVEDTYTKMVFHEKIADGVFRIYNGSGATVNQGDYVYIGGMLGVALQKALNTEYFDLRVDDEMEVATDALTAGANTFGTLYQGVYFNPAGGTFGDNAGTGIFVGRLSMEKDTNGNIKFFNQAKGTPSGPFQIELNVAADASAGLEFDLGFDYAILDVVAFSTATVPSATATLSGGTNDITNALDIDTVSVRTAATTIDNVYRTISGTDVLTVTTASAADRCRLVLTVQAV
jgi:hypothetical protein